MDCYGYPYPPQFPQVPIQREYDQGDGFKEYYEMGALKEDRDLRRPSHSKHRNHKAREPRRSTSCTRSSSRSQSGTRSRTRTRSRSHSRSNSRSSTGSRQHQLSLKEPSFLDAFRVLYLTPSKHKKNTAKYLATKKRQDRIQEALKSDGLGSKRWLFYPRSQLRIETVATVANSRDTCDQRFKVDADFFRKYKRSKKVDSDAPIAKLKKWELILYKKLGFIQAV